jgi:hypothetical protein
VVEHFAAALVVQGVSGWGWDGVLDWYQDSTHQVWIAGVFNVAADGHDRDLVWGALKSPATMIWAFGSASRI